MRKRKGRQRSGSTRVAAASPGKPSAAAGTSRTANVDFAEPRLVSVAAAHNVSAVQVALRWIAQQDIPFAVSPGLNEQYAVSLTPAQQSKGYQTQIGFVC